MKWLIVEDALKDRKGHWVEYVDTFRSGLKARGDSVTILAEQHAESFIRSWPDTHAVLPDSIWHRMSDQASRVKRLARIPQHGFQTQKAVLKWLKSHPLPDVIFVPTVLVHHLLGWWRIYESYLKHTPTKLLLFFPNAPLNETSGDDQAELRKDPSSRLFQWLIRRIAPAVHQQKVILGTETAAMQRALSQATGVPFAYLPHPVNALPNTTQPKTTDLRRTSLHFGCYGAARHEKGSDLLQQAIELHLDAHPHSTSSFSIQWLQDFNDPDGRLISPSKRLRDDPRVTFIDRYFGEGEYDRQIQKTDVMLLPYRSPYRYRVSRVVIEAMVNGLPLVASRGTTLWEQASCLGAAIPCEMDNQQSLAAAIAMAEQNWPRVKAEAISKMPHSQQHFSVDAFAQQLSESMSLTCPKS